MTVLGDPMGGDWIRRVEPREGLVPLRRDRRALPGSCHHVTTGEKSGGRPQPEECAPQLAVPLDVQPGDREKYTAAL